MTPLVRTYITTQTDTAKTKRQREHIHLVSVDELNEGDFVVEPTLTQLAEFPAEEFEDDGASGRAKDQLIFQAGIVSRSPTGGFAEMEWKDAVALVKMLGDTVRDDVDEASVGKAEEKLAVLFDAEVGRTPPRKSVVKAFKAAGLGDAQDFKV